MNNKKVTSPEVICLEHINCDFCGCPNYKIRYRKPDNWLWLNQFEYPVVECIECGLVYLNPRPTIDSMKYFYGLEYHEKRDSMKHKKRYEAQLRFLPKLSNEKILDIGCAKGDFLIFLKERYPNIQPVGIDYYSQQVNSNIINFHNNLLPDCKFKTGEFDLVTAWAVFEHLHHPSEYFSEVHRILKKGGKFIFLVTNADSLYGTKANIEDVPRHTYHFTEKSLRNYASKFGFDFTKCNFDDQIYDGRGRGTFYYSIQNVFGVSWEDRFFGRINRIQRYAGKIGQILDAFVFKSHWETKKKKSGIIINEFKKL